MKHIITLEDVCGRHECLIASASSTESGISKKLKLVSLISPSKIFTSFSVIVTMGEQIEISATIDIDEAISNYNKY